MENTALRRTAQDALADRSRPSTDVPALLEHHYQELHAGSGLSLEVIREQRYRSAWGAHDLEGYRFPATQLRGFPALVLPVHPPDGTNGLAVIKPDMPRKEKKPDGRETVIKYEWPAGTRLRLDVPVRCRPQLADPNVLVVYTEGNKKAAAAAQHGLCAVSLNGVWGFRDKAGPLPDFEHIKHRGRHEAICFDSFVMRRPEVAKALDAFRAYLESLGAVVSLVYLPHQPDGSEMKLDDYLLSHTADDFRALIGRPPAEDGNSVAAGLLNSGPLPGGGIKSIPSQAPTLPAEAQPADEAKRAAETARGWLDAYCDGAVKLAPRSPRALHELFGLGAQMAAIARRVYLQAGPKRVYPSIFGIFVGRSTLTAKTTAEAVVKLTFKASGLEHLLFPSRFTAEALVARMGLSVPLDVKEGGADVQARWQQRMQFAAQGLILRDEVHGLLEDCNRDYNAGLLPLILEMDGSPDWLQDSLTISRGQIEVRNVCVSLLGATTPAGLRQHAAKEYHWHNGLFGRFALVDEPTLTYAFWDQTASSVSADVVEGLKALYNAFPAPAVRFETTVNEKGAERIIGATQEGYAGGMAARITPEAWAAYAAYDKAVWRLLSELHLGERLDATYGRLPLMALKTALTHATSQWATGPRKDGQVPVVTLAHWTAGQEFAERCRVSAHRILAQAVQTAAEDQMKETVDKVCRFLQANGGRAQSSDVQRGTHLDKDELTAAVAASDGRLVAERHKTGSRGQPPTWISLHSPAVAVSPKPAPPAPPPAAGVPAGDGIDFIPPPGTEGQFSSTPATELPESAEGEEALALCARKADVLPLVRTGADLPGLVLHMAGSLDWPHVMTITGQHVGPGEADWRRVVQSPRLVEPARGLVLSGLKEALARRLAGVPRSEAPAVPTAPPPPRSEATADDADGGGR